MSEAAVISMEITFNLLYLATIWTLVCLMFMKRDSLSRENRRVAKLFLLAFFLLALGDTGHVGFRVLAYAAGGLEANPLLVGGGSLATALTVTFFYMIVAEIWRIRSGSDRNPLWWFLISVGLLRLILMAFPQNNWGQVVPPKDWSLLRNIPLMIQGILIAIVMHITAVKNGDIFMKRVSFMIYLSYLFYTPVILYIQEVPILGMLMIPKTLAYVAIAFMAFALFRTNRTGGIHEKS